MALDAVMPFILIVALFIAYIIGSIPFGLVLTRFFTKQDLRKIGSGNIGATNVLRTGNKKLALVTLLLDTTKGIVAIFVLSLIANGYIYSYPDTWQYAFFYSIFGFGAILGHCFPVWLKFKGGKGVATALGVLLAATPLTGLVACGVWLASAFAFKISSLAALIAIGIAPIITLFIYGTAPAAVTALIALLVFWRHKDNIKRLMKGEEPKIGTKKKQA